MSKKKEKQIDELYRALVKAGTLILGWEKGFQQVLGNEFAVSKDYQKDVGELASIIEKYGRELGYSKEVQDDNK